MSKKVHAYMSGALTNLSSALTIPPCCQVNGELRERFEKLKTDYDFQQLARTIDREQKAHYERIADQVCKPLEVELYLPHRHSDPEHDADLTAETVHFVDRLRVTSSSFVIACGDIPSLGVGQELEIAAQAGIPVIAYKHIRTRTSRMFLGNPILCEDTLRGLHPDEDSEKVIEYDTEEELFGRLRRRIEFLLDYLDRSVEPAYKRDSFKSFAERLAYYVDRTPGMDARRLAAKLGLPGTYSTFLLKTSDKLRDHFWAAMPKTVERFDEVLARGYDFDNFTNPSLMVLRQIATVLNLSLAELLGLSEGLSERDERVIQYLINDHAQVALHEFNTIRAQIPPGISQRELRQKVAEVLHKIRGE